MPIPKTPLFDSRKLDTISYFSCHLPSGKYTLSSAEAAALQGEVVVGPAREQDPGSTSVTLTVDDQGNLKLSAATPSPIMTQEGAFLLFDFFSEQERAVAYSLQLTGLNGAIDTRTLMDGQVFGRSLSPAGTVTYEAYLLVPSTGSGPASYVLKQSGELRVSDDALVGEPILITVEQDGPIPPLIEIPTYSLVTWQFSNGPWYLIATIAPLPESGGTQ